MPGVDLFQAEVLKELDLLRSDQVSPGQLPGLGDPRELELDAAAFVQEVLQRVHVLVLGQVEAIEGGQVQVIGQRAVLDEQVEEGVGYAQEEMQHVDHVAAVWYDLVENGRFRVAEVDQAGRRRHLFRMPESRSLWLRSL